MSGAFQVDIPVRFAHCDPAGIVFFPRYMEMLNQTIEDWFAGPLQTSLNSLFVGGKHAIPTAVLNTRFHSPSRLGDMLTFSLRVASLGRSSCTVVVTASCDEALRVDFTQTLVFVSIDPFSPKPWPAELRARIEPFLIPSQE